MTTKKKQISGKSKASKPSEPTKANNTKKGADYEQWHRANHSKREHEAWLAGGKVMDDLPETHEKLTAKELARRKAEKKRLLRKLSQDSIAGQVKAAVGNNEKVALLKKLDRHSFEETDMFGNRLVAGYVQAGKSEVLSVTTYYPDGSTSVVYGAGCQLMRGSTGFWRVSFDFGEITDLAIKNTLIGIRRKIEGGLLRAKQTPTNDEKLQISRDAEVEARQRYSTLRYWMTRVEAARRGDEVAERELWDCQKSGGTYSSEASAVILEATQLLEKVAYRDAESERLMDAVFRLANLHDRIPTKAEVGRFRAEPHAGNGNTPSKATYSGRTYVTTSKLQDRLNAAGIGWLPAGVRGKSRST